MPIDLLLLRPNNVEMPKMNFHPERLFDTNQGENAVWSQLQDALVDRDGDTFYRLPIIDTEGRFVFEPDIVVVLRGYAPLVIECKGCRLDDIGAIHGAVWMMADSWYRAQENPFNQARSQAIALAKMLGAAGVWAVRAHSLVALPFIAREDWEGKFGERNITAGMLFAEDIASAEEFAARLIKTAGESRLTPGQWNRVAEVLGAHDRWLNDAVDARPTRMPSTAPPVAPLTTPTFSVPQGEVRQPINILRYAGRPPTVAEIAAVAGIDSDTPEVPRPYTYLVATAALERQRSKDGLGGQHQLKKQLREDAKPAEEMQLLFHKALRHFIATPTLKRTEERVLIQRAIRDLAQGERTVADQLRRDVFAWRDVLAEMEEEGLDLAAGGGNGMEWAHPDLERIASQLQSTYRKMRRSSDFARPTFEEAARQYLRKGYVPTSIVVMEGFTRLTPLQQEFIERCAGTAGIQLWIVLPYKAGQEAGFAALDRTYERFLARAALVELATPPLGEQPSLAYLQAGLFSLAAARCPHDDDGVELRAFAHRNDEVAYCVGEVIRLIHDEAILAARDIAIVCSDPQGMAPLLREEAELLGHADLFAVPPRQLLLTPVGRFILVLYEVWRGGALEMEAEQLAVLLASGWLGAHAQRRAELFTSVSREHFTFCLDKKQWSAAFDRIAQQMEEGDAVLGQLANRLPSSLVTNEDLATWRQALDIIECLCQRVFAAGERAIGDHIALLLDQIEQLDPDNMLKTERRVLVDIRDALEDIVDSRSVSIDASEFGEVLAGLIYERGGEEDGDLPGSKPGARPQQVWVVGPEGIDNIERHTVFFLGLDESRMPAPGSPPWPRITWSAQEHAERQRYRFLAVVRAARRSLRMSYARQDWEHSYQPSPYFDETVYLLGQPKADKEARANASSSEREAAVARIQIERDRYTLSELAVYKLCPYRFKMEALTRSAGVYANVWQLEWLACGIWLAETLYRVATGMPGRHASSAVRIGLEQAIDDVRPRVQARLPGLRPLAWIEIERKVRATVEYLLQPSGSEQRPLLGVAISNPRDKIRRVLIREKNRKERPVDVVAEAEFLEFRGDYLNAIRETNQSALWLIAGRAEQAISEDVGDETLFRTLSDAVKWWRDIRFWMTIESENLRAPAKLALVDRIKELEQGKFTKNPGDHCKYCPVVDTCMGRKP